MLANSNSLIPFVQSQSRYIFLSFSYNRFSKRWRLEEGPELSGLMEWTSNTDKQQPVTTRSGILKSTVIKGGIFSVQYKFYLKGLIMVHFFTLFTMWAKVGGEVLAREFGITSTLWKRLDLPTAYPWEYVWCLSFIPCIFAILAFPKNNVCFATFILLQIYKQPRYYF